VLRVTNHNLERRWRRMEELAAGAFAGLTLVEEERLWQPGKAEEEPQATSPA
jgi:hypothetical protein